VNVNITPDTKVTLENRTWLNVQNKHTILYVQADFKFVVL